MEFLKKTTQISFQPWFVFIVFAVTNYFLAYIPLSYVTKSWLAVFGLLIPWFGAVLSPRQLETSNLFYLETFQGLSEKWFLPLFCIGAVFFRFYRLTHFYLWPTGDEGLHGFLAIPLISKWDWRFFYTVGEHPPLLIWSLVPFFKYFDSPFFNIWFLPAFFSSITVPVGYWTSRQFFSKSFSWFFGFLLAFSFWPLYFGRFCHQGLFLPFWELLGFVLLSFFVKAKIKYRKVIWVFGLGLWVGLGSLTFMAWSVVILLFVLTVLMVWFYLYRDIFLYLISFFVGLFLGVLPFAIAVFGEGFGHHLIDSSAASHYFTPVHEIITHVSYVTCLFWGSLQNGSSYAPLWGGVLNPILGSCFFVGTIELICRWNEKKTFWICVAFFILFLPGLISADYVEFNRVIQVMPFLLLVTALGMQGLMRTLSDGKKWIFVPLILCSFCLDMNHLLKPAVDGPTWRLNFKKEIPDENFKAYQILNNDYSINGPGLIFSDFMPLTHGHTLHVTTYHFNAALNSKLSIADAKWAGVMVNVHYQKYLEKRFPGSTWERVTPHPQGQGGSVVGLIPINQNNVRTLIHWCQAHQYFYGLNLQAEKMYNNPKLYRSVLEHFSDGYPLVKDDPFLESCFGEWMTQFHWGSDHQQNILLMKRVLQTGYPCAHLYYKLGEYLFLDHRFLEAKEVFKRAMKCRPNETDAVEWIREIDQIMTENKGKIGRLDTAL